jgi:hypothetical protein
MEKNQRESIKNVFKLNQDKRSINQKKKNKEKVSQIQIITEICLQLDGTPVLSQKISSEEYNPGLPWFRGWHNTGRVEIPHEYALTPEKLREMADALEKDIKKAKRLVRLGNKEENEMAELLKVCYKEVVYTGEQQNSSKQNITQ